MKTKTESTRCYCRKCGEPVTWFNYQNIWEGGKITGRKHINCNSPDILHYKDNTTRLEVRHENR